MGSIHLRQSRQNPPREGNIHSPLTSDSSCMAWDRSTARFSSLSLKELGKASLLDRRETKYVFPHERILELLPGLESEYLILEIQGRRSFDYRSVYYDLPGLEFFSQHQAGALPRWKIRQRTYLNTGQSFLEIKYKDNRKRTQKSRQLIPQPTAQFTDDELAFLTSRFPGRISELRPVLETQYSRITLVHRNKQERITLDSDMKFSDGFKSHSLPKLIVAEIKQDRYNPRSPFRTQLKKASIRPGSFSKYCIGTILIDPKVKHNRFKPILHQHKILTYGENLYERSL